MAGVYSMMIAMAIAIVITLYYLNREKQTSALTYVVMYFVVFSLFVGIISVKSGLVKEETEIKELLADELVGETIEGDVERIVELKGEAYRVDVKKNSSGNIQIVKYEKIN